MRTFRNEAPVQNGHLVQRRYDFYGDDTVVRDRVTSGTIVSATSNQVYLDSAAQSVINFLIYSEEFNKWSTGGSITVDSNYTTDPDGNQTAGILTGSGDLNDFIRLIISSSDILTSTDYIFSVYVRLISGNPSGDDVARIAIYDDSTTFAVNTIGSNISSSWTKFSTTGTTTSSLASDVSIQIRLDEAITIAVAKAQLELGTSVGRYIKTEGAIGSDSDFYNNYGITIDSGTGSGQDHLRVNDYTVSLVAGVVTRVCDLSGDWIIIPDSTSKYSLIERGY